MRKRQIGGVKIAHRGKVYRTSNPHIYMVDMVEKEQFKRCVPLADQEWIKDLKDSKTNDERIRAIGDGLIEVSTQMNLFMGQSNVKYQEFLFFKNAIVVWLSILTAVISPTLWKILTGG